MIPCVHYNPSKIFRNIRVPITYVGWYQGEGYIYDYYHINSVVPHIRAVYGENDWSFVSVVPDILEEYTFMDLLFINMIKRVKELGLSFEAQDSYNMSTTRGNQ